MSGTARPALYVAIVVLAALAALAAKQRLQGAFACPARVGAVYLSDCSVPGYGDYDHGAFHFGLEPAAIEAARRARVVFLGNSRAQFGFSSDATVRWFGQRSIPFYALGFSHYESITFAAPVLARVQPTARAYVINADRFFAEWLSPTSRRVLQERDARERYVEKRFWQRLHGPVCGALPALCGRAMATYRDIGNGIWTTGGTLPDHPGGVADGPAADRDRWPQYTVLAGTFLSTLKVDPRCIVLTIVPYADTKRAEAEAIAAALGLAFVAPRVEGLRTFDGSHLDAPSAERWSAAFLAEAGPVLERCAAGA